MCAAWRFVDSRTFQKMVTGCALPARRRRFCTEGGLHAVVCRGLLSFFRIVPGRSSRDAEAISRCSVAVGVAST